MSGAEAERAWWDSLTGDEILNNTAGYPPYDVEAVADTVTECLGPLHSMSRILDLGCGTGRLTNVLAARHPDMEFTGVDVAPSLLERARYAKLKNTTYRLCDGRNLPESLGLLDGAYSITMFQHIPHEAQAQYIAQVGDHLRRGAYFVFNVAIGAESTFLSHQVADHATVVDWLDASEMVHLRFFRRHGWDWCIARKAHW